MRSVSGIFFIIFNFFFQGNRLAFPGVRSSSTYGSEPFDGEPITMASLTSMFVALGCFSVYTHPLSTLLIKGKE